MRLNLSNFFSNSLIVKFLDNYYVENSFSTHGVWIICVKKIKIAVEKNKKRRKTPYKTTTQNGASLLEAIVGRRQCGVSFFGIRLGTVKPQTFQKALNT